MGHMSSVGEFDMLQASTKDHNPSRHVGMDVVLQIILLTMEPCDLFHAQTDNLLVPGMLFCGIGWVLGVQRTYYSH